MNEASTARNKAIEQGVKLRRLTDNAFRSMGETPVAEVGPIDLCTRFTAVAEQPKTALVDFRQTVMDGRDANGLTDDDRKTMGELAGLAKSLTDSLDGAAESQTRLTKEEGEMARFVNRGRLQQDLLDAATAAARLDQRLVGLSKTWQVDVDTASKLGPVVPAATKQKPPARQNRPEAKANEPAARLIVGDALSGTWTDGRGDYESTASVTSVDGNRVTIRITPSFNPAGYSIVVVLNGEQATIVSFVSHEPRPSAFKPQNMRGTFRDGLLDVGGPAEKTDGKGVKTVSEWRFKLQMSRKAAAPADRLKRGDKLEGLLMIAGKPFPATATIEQISRDSAVVRVDNGVGVWDYTLQITGDNAKLGGIQRTNNSRNSGNVISNWDIQGTLSPTGVELNGHWTLQQPNGKVTRDAVQLTLTKK